MEDNNKINYYDVLNIDRKATHDEIKKAYRKLSLKYHPDKNPNSKELFLKINDAYATLGDPDKKKKYDMMFSYTFFSDNPSAFFDSSENLFSELFKNINVRDSNLEKNNSNSNSNKQVFQLFKEMLPHAVKLAQNYSSHNDDNVDLGNCFFSQHSQQKNNLEKPTPILKNMVITMQQVYNGASIPLLVERWIIINGIKTFETETIYISIPKGVDQNEMIVLREKGNIVNEFLKGDIKIFIQIENHSGFKRDGLNLILEKTISLKEALCGFTFDFLFLNGKRYMINTEGTLISPEYQKNIPKMGLTRGTEDIGDLIILFHVIFPTELSCEKISSLKEIL